jgi:hypothetical protein
MIARSTIEFKMIGSILEPKPDQREHGACNDMMCFGAELKQEDQGAHGVV